ncbi:hypothetical protein BAXH7_03169 [Bacillus amyloliquefaciens XH7]|nr:hypothetical protein BAXH7_03169 [Bacillus amyloliquefaciens XH7]
MSFLAIDFFAMFFAVFLNFVNLFQSFTVYIGGLPFYYIENLVINEK